MPALEALAEEQGWGRRSPEGFVFAGEWPGDGRSIPMTFIFGRWTRVICAYLEGGLDALVELACEPPARLESLRTFAVGLLDDVGTAEAVVAATRVIRGLLPVLARKAKRRSGWGDPRETLFKAVHALEDLLFSKAGPALTEVVEREVRNALHAVLAVRVSEDERAFVYTVLERVGDASSLALIASLPPLRDSVWRGLETKVEREVKKRLKAGRPAPTPRAAPGPFESTDVELTVVSAEEQDFGWSIVAAGPGDTELAIELGPGVVVLRSTGPKSDAFLRALARVYELKAPATVRMRDEVELTWAALQGSLDDVASARLATKLFHEKRPYAEVYLNIDLPAGEVELLEKDADYRAPIVKLLTRR